MTTLSKIQEDFIAAAQTGATPLENIEYWADKIPPFLLALEQSHQLLVANIAALIPGLNSDISRELPNELSNELSGKLALSLDGAPLPEEGDNELGNILYWLANPAEALPMLSAVTTTYPGFDAVWNAMLKAAPAPLLSATNIANLQSLLTAAPGVLATSDGTIIGFEKYEQLDKGWAWTAVNRVLNWWDGIADFKTTDEKFCPTQLVPNKDGTVRIAIIGDWGTGTFTETGNPDPDGPAAGVMKTVVELAPDYIIHVGDTYYAGTNAKRPPHGEEAANLVNLWKQITGATSSDRFFTLNSNHEMYGGAEGLYGVALADPIFSAQGELTYFSLQFGNWLIGGFDSAYYSPSITYLTGGLGSQKDDPKQYEFLSDFKAYAATGASGGGQMNTMLMCHHNPIDTFANEVKGPLWGNVTDTFTPDYWYWGHIHMGAIYSDDATVWTTTKTKTKARCIGHSAIPIATPWGFEEPANAGNADWYANTPLNGGTPAPPGHLPVEHQPRIKNGFAIITLGADGSILEETYDQGSTTRTWPPLDAD